MRDLFENAAAEARHRGGAPRRAAGLAAPLLRHGRERARRRGLCGARSTASRCARRRAALLAAPTLGLAQAHRRRMGGAARNHRSGKNAADAARQCDHRWRVPSARAGRGRDREISRLRSCLLSRRRAAGTASNARRQHWDPVLAWAREALGARFSLGEGVVHVAQPEAALAAARAAIPADPWRLGAVHAVTTLTGSALIALALARGGLSAEAAWQAAHVDEDWNMEQWGRDELALERRAFRLRRVLGGGDGAAGVRATLSEAKPGTRATQRLPAGDAHVPREGRPLVAAVDDEIVALGLARNRFVDGGEEEVVALGGAQRLAQIGGILLAEAHIQRAGAGDAHAIAGFAEIVGERRDEAEPAAGLGDAYIARRAAGAVVEVVER